MTDKKKGDLQFSFNVKGLRDELFTVIAFEGYEAISRPYRFSVTMMARSSEDIKIETLLARNVTLKIQAQADFSRIETVSYQGVLEQFEELQKGHLMSFYRAVLIPRFARNKLDRRSELFTKKQSVNLTLSDLLKESIKPQSSENAEFKLSDQYPSRDSVCQYDESTFDFVSRWLEKEGMFYYFDHSGATEKMVVVDKNVLLPATMRIVQYRPNESVRSNDADGVQAFTSRSIPCPKTVTLRDSNHLKAATSIQESATVPQYANFSYQDMGEVMIYGEDLRDEVQAKRYAKVRAEEIACGRTCYFGTSSVVGLQAGYFMGMANMPLSMTMPRDGTGEELEMEFLVTEIQHTGSQAKTVLEGLASPFEDFPEEMFYRNTFTAIHRTVQFRPARTTPKPHVAGTMTATVFATQNDVPELNEYGMYRLKLPFATVSGNAEKITPPVRMATTYAGEHHGMDFPLHNNAEVLLSFLNGDPDQPVIMNAVPNSENPAIVNSSNPSINQIRTAGGNYITMNDDEGKQSVRLDAANQRGTFMLGFGMLGQSLHFSPNGQVSIAGIATYDYVGALGSTSAAVGSRYRAGLMNDLDVLKEHLTYTGKSAFSWAGEGSSVKSMSLQNTVAIENVKRTAAAQSITLEAGYDDLDLKTKELQASVSLYKKYSYYYMTAMKFANYLPGLGVMASALRSLPTAASDFVDEHVTHANFSQGNYIYNLDAYSDANDASLVTIGSVGAIYKLFTTMFKKYEDMTYVSRMNLSKEGIDFKFLASSMKPELKMSMNDKGISQSATSEIGIPVSVTEYVDTETGAGMTTKKDLSHASIKLDLDGNVRVTGSNDIKLSGKSMSMESAAASVNVGSSKIGVVAQMVEVGFEIASPQGLQVQAAQKQLAELEAQKNTILQKLSDQKIALENLVRPGAAPMASPSPLAAAMDDDVDILEEAAAAMAKNIELTTEKLKIEAELAAVEQIIEATTEIINAPISKIMTHGLTVSAEAVELKTQAFSVTASNTEITLGNASSGIKVDLMGVAIDDGKLIKIG